ncbi:diguanylate cyclase [Sphingomonas sp. Leaf38]|uniref:diguanylate cyclase n=1 Tax=Sphingomonas sp. Leaf38 TaxID=1736217 RepID=UPI000A420908|nr:diguanylate cyclase [Sphingomonas sp. Leaf38]
MSAFSLSSLSARIGWLGACVSLAMLALALLLVDASVRMKASLDWVSRTEQLIHKIDETMADLREAESGQRGFLLTHDRSYARNFDYRTVEATNDTVALAALTRDNPEQHDRAVALQRIVAQKIASLRMPLSLGQSGHFAEAIAIVANGHGRNLMDEVARRAGQLRDEERDLLAVRLYAAEQQSAWNRHLPLVGGPTIIALFAVAVVLIIRGVRRPIRSMLRSMRAFGEGDRDARVTDAIGTAEFRALAEAYNAMADRLAAAGSLQSASDADLQRANAELRCNADTLQARSEMIELLGGMSHRMQTARTDAELAAVIACFVPRVLPSVPGALYAHNHSRNLLIRLASWGDLSRAREAFPPEQCWGLRRGQGHYIVEPGTDVICAHVGDPGAVYHCEPLLAGGEVIGLLYLEGVVEAESRFRLAVLTENIASALLNHQLQRGLREQTIRDPLTALFNRRYMEEALAIEIARAAPAGTPLGLVMCDVDHFKRFNDEFGHDAGDIVLRAVATEMTRHFRDGDVVCRYGGEEFTIIAPGATLPVLLGRVERLRIAIAETSVRHGDRALGAIRMSFGIAMWYPEMDRDGSTLIQRADNALYRAKRAGRDQVMIADEVPALSIAAE